jgi:hypothetical protein
MSSNLSKLTSTALSGSFASLALSLKLLRFIASVGDAFAEAGAVRPEFCRASICPI